MIFESKLYCGPCDCGKNHILDTEFCIIESGCLKNVYQYLESYSLRGVVVAVYDENTYQATADRHPKVDYEVVLSPENLHADEHGVELLMEKLPEKADVLIAIGSGTIHDITRYCAYCKKIEFVSCPTAASVDGFCSSVAAMTWNGCKKTLTAVAPKIVVADLDIIKKAPVHLAKSGFGDMVGKYVALTDWNIGKILKNEYFCDKIAGMTLDAAEASLSSVEGILQGDEKAFETLTYGLLLSGLAMQMVGNSRPASGSEHHISHLIEMQPVGLNVSSEALHGEKVGVGTLMVLRKYQALLEESQICFSDYKTFSTDEIKAVFDEKADEIVKENAPDCANEISAETIKLHFDEICELIKKLPDVETLTEFFKNSQMKSTLSDIDVSEEKCDDLLKFAPMVRNRLTLLRLLSQKAIY